MLGKTLSELTREKVSSQAVVDFYTDRIQKHNKDLYIFLSDKHEGEGMPIALKDNILTKGQPSTASADILEGFMPPYEATLVQNMRTAGYSILGKTNMDAWAHGSSTETSDYGVTKNPYNHEHVPGGSSGGSAAAVASGLALAAIGTETAGSTRLPAAWSGVVGLKPTYGRVSRFGVIAMGSSWDCPGPITQTVEDAAVLLEALAGHDAHDATSISEPVEEYAEILRAEKSSQNFHKPLTIGIPEEYFNISGDFSLQPDIRASFEKSVELLKKLGHTIKTVHLMDPKYAISVYMILQRSEVSSNLGRYDGIRYGKNRSHFGQEAERRIMLGTYALSTGYADKYYKKAQKVRYKIREDFENAFENVDVIFAPTTPITATKIGDNVNFSFYGEMMDVLTEPAAAAGIPAISIPSGLDSTGLPIGMQFMGPHLGESKILSIANQLEDALEFDRLEVMKRYM